MIRRMLLDDRADYGALVVRTAYGDAQAWAAVSGLLCASASLNRFLGRRDFQDYSSSASKQPDGVFRGFSGAQGHSDSRYG